MNKELYGLFAQLSARIWGNLRSREARNAWAKAQVARCKAEDNAFAEELTRIGFPEEVARKAWATGSRANAIKYLSQPEIVDFVKYHKLENQVRNAFENYRHED